MKSAPRNVRQASSLSRLPAKEDLGRHRQAGSLSDIIFGHYLRSFHVAARRPETMKIGGEGSASGPRLRGFPISTDAEAAQPRPACATFSEEVPLIVAYFDCRI